MTSTTPASPLTSFKGKISPAKVSIFYQAGLAVVALAMILLPLIYIALIVLAGKLVWWHLVNNVTILQGNHGRGSIIILLVYAGPAVAGLIFILFLLKPLFAGREKIVPSYQIDEINEPLLFAFVRKICEVVGSPVPREIQLDTQVNASAGFRRGWRSMFSNDLVLVIGLPLVAGMSMRQVAGVLAHEFGHFAQGAGMRFTFIIRKVNAWFARVVYQRDRWDDLLDDWAQTEYWALRLVFIVAKGGVWLGRKILWCLMNMGHAISCFMSRQMEFDADSYEAKVAGSDEFARTSQSLVFLSAAHQAAMSDAYQTYQSRELPDNLPALVQWRESTLSEATRQALDKSVANSKTSWNDTHPSNVSRIKAAAALNAEGVFHDERPASELFTDFEAISRTVTCYYFLEELEVSHENVRFKNITTIVGDRKSADVSSEQLDAFFAGQYSVLRALPIRTDISGSWQQAEQQMHSSLESHKGYKQQYEAMYAKFASQSAGNDLIRANFTLQSPAEFLLPSSMLSEAEVALSQTQNELQRLSALMRPFESAVQTKLGIALAVWRQKQASASERKRFDRLLTAQQHLARLLPRMLQAELASHSLDLTLNNIRNHNNPNTLLHKAREMGQRIEAIVNECLNGSAEVRHPYLEDQPPLFEALKIPLQPENEWGRLFQQAHILSEAMIPLLVRCTGELCGLAMETDPQELEMSEPVATIIPGLPPPLPQPVVVAAPSPAPHTGKLPPPTGL